MKRRNGIDYRVDRVSSAIVPCGMNSIRYLGNSWRKAREVFDETQPGKDTWDRDNAAYGVILSVWNGYRYVVKAEKGLS